MKLVPIFDDPKPTLYAVQYEGNTDEFHRLFELWQDPEYLRSFFKEHQKDLEQGFYKSSVKDAVRTSLEEAQLLEDRILDCCEEGHYDVAKSLQSFFKALNNDDYSLYSLQKTKARQRWLRLYAVRIAPNLYVISGGAIKLTKLMDDREHTKTEKDKLEQTVEFLKELGLLDPDDFEVLEL